jgi:hypothetical protein
VRLTLRAAAMALLTVGTGELLKDEIQASKHTYQLSSTCRPKAFPWVELIK